MSEGWLVHFDRGRQHVHPGRYRRIAEILYPRSAVPVSPPPFLLTPTITVHYAEQHRRYHRDDERDDEKVHDRLHLVLPVVGRHHDRLVQLGVVAGKDRALEAVHVGEVFARDRRRVAAALDIHQQDRFVGPLDVGQIEQLRGRRVERERKVQIVDKRHIDMGTLEHIRGAALAA